MAKELTELQLLTELEPSVADNLNRHLSLVKPWNPHDYVPWSEGRNYAALGGVDWEPEQSELSEVARVAMITNLLTEDNLPSYHRYISENLSTDGAWGTWVGTWTAEENRHGIAMRDYLVVTRGVDPIELEKTRTIVMTRGIVAPPDFGGVLIQSAYVTFQEVATRVSHRQTGRVCNDPIADNMLKRIALDENLHSVFYRNITGAAFDLAPDQTMDAVTRVVKEFDMPGRGMPNWRRNGVLMVKHGIYDLRQHLDEVLIPTLKKWKVFDRNDFGPLGEQRRNELGEYLDKLQHDVVRFEERRAHLLEREAAKAAKKAEAAKAAARA
ncbi:acyl-ACP desaturase [Mycobacterium koreense]|uniref:Acyl-ACP desaturase n=1 Tax=Mycolicibacillus koreensis TaxID=1069220 RepID=A0A7I7SLC0_9MYCO|nr:acyl-ACP desaturase [Mycolicibacillus koreensis]MCV7249703.1 acyl-ACP desaturase [Mycolicibacillus koreensis]OSC32984.1 acyl-ACP desaturase [Mycolicibacillus koreensis]BBY56815.1 putative acyl-[acyl-carrier protein] desaturase [Mycolicibacillus koreensis]